MEIGFQRIAQHADGLLDALFAIDNIFLRDDINDLFPGIHIQVEHVLMKRINILLADLVSQYLS